MMTQYNNNASQQRRGPSVQSVGVNSKKSRNSNNQQSFKTTASLWHNNGLGKPDIIGN